MLGLHSVPQRLKCTTTNMAARRPLTELRAMQIPQQARPRQQKVYGKRARVMAQHIFYTSPSHSNDDRDDKENSGVVEQLENLRLSDTAKDDTAIERGGNPTEEGHLSEKLGNHSTGATPQVEGSKTEIENQEEDVDYEAWNQRFASKVCEMSERHPKIRSFTKFFAKLDEKFSIQKIGEGCSADVYQMVSLEEPDKVECILKVIPIRSVQDPSRIHLISFNEVIREIHISRTLSYFHGFAEYRDVAVVQGFFPSQLLKATREFRDVQHSGRPDPESVFTSPHQLFVILELGNAGQDMEILRKPSAFAVYDIFWYLTIFLSNAERDLLFEHRDLHISNVCIQKWHQCGTLDVDSKTVAGWGMDDSKTAGISNIRPTIIDYTNSRSNVAKTSDEHMWNEETSWSRFTYKGRGFENQVQCNGYRRMQECIEERHGEFEEEASPSEKASGVSKYSLFAPKTNVVWLMVLLQILCKRGANRAVRGSNSKAVEVQEKIWAVLNGILEEYQECPVSKLPAGAREFLQRGMERCWISEDEIAAYTAIIEEH